MISLFHADNKPQILRLIIRKTVYLQKTVIPMYIHEHKEWPSFSRIYLGVHYPGDVLCGAVSGCVMAVLVYWLYHAIKKKYFECPQYISGQYTSSGFAIADIHLFYSVLLLTCLYIVVAGMMVSKYLHF